MHIIMVRAGRRKYPVSRSMSHAPKHFAQTICISERILPCSTKTEKDAGKIHRRIQPKIRFSRPCGLRKNNHTSTTPTVITACCSQNSDHKMERIKSIPSPRTTTVKCSSTSKHTLSSRALLLWIKIPRKYHRQERNS